MTIKTALVGCGRWGKILLKSLLQMEDFEIVALIDCDEEAFCFFPGMSLPGSIATYSDMDAMIDAVGPPDAFVIATPASTHAEFVTHGLDVGAHVFCEKPLVLDYERLEFLASRFVREDQILQVGYEYAWWETWGTGKREAYRGLIVSDIREFRGHWFNDGQVRDDVGGCLNTLVHPASVMAALLWQCAIKIRASRIETGHSLQNGVATVIGQVQHDDPKAPLLHYVMDTSWHARRKERRMIFTFETTETVFNDVAKTQSTHSWPGHYEVASMTGLTPSVKLELAGFAKAIKDGKPRFKEPQFTALIMELLGMGSHEYIREGFVDWAAL